MTESVEQIAEQFHYAYEELAARLGYETRPESRTTWEQVPVANRELMIATVKRLLDDGVIALPPPPAWTRIPR